MGHASRRAVRCAIPTHERSVEADDGLFGREADVARGGRPHGHEFFGGRRV